MHKKAISQINHEYNALLKSARKRLERERVLLKNRKGRVQSVHLNSGGVRVDILFDDGDLEKDIDALQPDYDP